MGRIISDVTPNYKLDSIILPEFETRELVDIFRNLTYLK
jgi:hypothetical protein